MGRSIGGGGAVPTLPDLLSDERKLEENSPTSRLIMRIINGAGFPSNNLTSPQPVARITHLAIVAFPISPAIPLSQ